MTKQVVNYLLFFIAGAAVAVGGVAAFDHGPWRWNGFSPSSIPFAGDWLLALNPATLACAALAISGATLLALYRREVTAYSGRVVQRPQRSYAAMPVAQKVEQPSPEHGEVSAVRDELERQLGRLIVLITDQLKSSKDHVASLKDTNTHLATVKSAGELREVLHSLIAKNESKEHQTRDLEARLQQAQEQAAMLQQRLVRAEKLAALDPLTSLANRRRLEQFLSAEVDQSHETGTPLCLIMTDIDHFKKVNDTYGHFAGDRVLKEFADLLASNVRGCDLVARYGGEEFAIVLPKTPMGDAFGLAERIRRLFERQGGAAKAVTHEYGRLTASFGVAEILDAEPTSALIQRADQMLYQAKNAGRNRTMLWSSSNTVAECV
jgi:diguanylate cyclase